MTPRLPIKRPLVSATKDGAFSVKLGPELYIRLRQRIPQTGIRGAVVRELIRMFVDDEVQVSLIARP